MLVQAVLWATGEAAGVQCVSRSGAETSSQATMRHLSPFLDATRPCFFQEVNPPLGLWQTLISQDLFSTALVATVRNWLLPCGTLLY